MSAVQQLMHGALVMACLVICVQFLKFWRLSRDRFFIFFALAFGTFAVGFTVRGLSITDHEYVVYLPRLVGFLIILFAIFDKNRSA